MSRHGTTAAGIALLAVLPLAWARRASTPAPVAPEVLQRRIAATQDRVLSAAARALAEHGAVVATTDRQAGLVQSQPLTVESQWEGVAVTTRVDCGKDMATVERALSNPVTLALGFITTPAGDSTTVRLNVNASGYDRVARSMAATNAAVAGLQGAYPCTLKPEFARQLLDEVVAAASRR